VKEEILRYETDLTLFLFYFEKNQVMILDGNAEKTLEMGQLYFALHDFFKTTRFSGKAATIQVIWENGVCRINFNYTVMEDKSSGTVTTIHYAEKKLESHWETLAIGWYYTVRMINVD